MTILRLLPQVSIQPAVIQPQSAQHKTVGITSLLPPMQSATSEETVQRVILGSSTASDIGRDVPYWGVETPLTSQIPTLTSATTTLVPNIISSTGDTLAGKMGIINPPDISTVCILDMLKYSDMLKYLVSNVLKCIRCLAYVPDYLSKSALDYLSKSLYLSPNMPPSSDTAPKSSQPNMPPHNIGNLLIALPIMKALPLTSSSSSASSLSVALPLTSSSQSAHTLASDVFNANRTARRLAKRGYGKRPSRGRQQREKRIQSEKELLALGACTNPISVTKSGDQPEYTMKKPSEVVPLISSLVVPLTTSLDKKNHADIISTKKMSEGKWSEDVRRNVVDLVRRNVGDDKYLSEDVRKSHYIWSEDAKSTETEHRDFIET